MSASYEHGYNEAWKEAREHIKEAREEGRVEGRKEERELVIVYVRESVKQMMTAARTWSDEARWRVLLGVADGIERGEHVEKEPTDER